MKKIYLSILFLYNIQINSSSLPITNPTTSFLEKVVVGARITGYATAGFCAGAGIPSLVIALKCIKESINGHIQFPTINPDVVVGCGVIGALVGGVFKYKKIETSVRKLDRFTGVLLLSFLKTQNQVLMGQILSLSDEICKRESEAIVEENKSLITLLSNQKGFNLS